MSFERAGVAGHQSLARDRLVYYNLATDHQQRAYDIVREHHALTVPRVNSRNSALSDAHRLVPKFDVGGWAWVYHTVSIIRQGAKPDSDVKILKAKFSLNLTDPYKILAVAPCSAADTPDGSPPGAKLMYLHIPSDIFAYSFRYARPHVGAFQSNAASPVPTPTTVATCRSIWQRG